MRAAVLVDPGAISPPPDQILMVLHAFAQWRNKWRDKMEVFQFWAGRVGGFAIVNTADEAELSQMMFEFPLTPFSVIDVRPIVDGDEALHRLIATFTQMLHQMQQAS